jgi:hypothetical protein
MITNQIVRSFILVRRAVPVTVMPIHDALGHRSTSFISNIFAYHIDLLIFHAEELSQTKRASFQQ